MTKLDMNLSSKKSDTIADDAVKEPSEMQNLQNNDNNKEPINEPLITFDWRLIKLTAISQMMLSAIAMTCVVSVIFLSMSMDCYNYLKLIVSMYLLLTAYSGIKGSNKSHRHLFAYCIMTILQWMCNIVFLVYLTCLLIPIYSEAPDEAYSSLNSLRGILTGDYGSNVVVLFTEIVANSTIIATIFTGLLGWNACYKGFGRLLAYQEAFLQTRCKSMEQA